MTIKKSKLNESLFKQVLSDSELIKATTYGVSGAAIGSGVSLAALLASGAGAAAGSVIPVVGTAAGAAIGGLIGARWLRRKHNLARSILILGPRKSGKSTLANILTAHGPITKTKPRKSAKLNIDVADVSGLLDPIEVKKNLPNILSIFAVFDPSEKKLNTDWVLLNRKAIEELVKSNQLASLTLLFNHKGGSLEEKALDEITQRLGDVLPDTRIYSYVESLLSSQGKASAIRHVASSLLENQA